MKKHNFNLSKIELDRMLKKEQMNGINVGLRWASTFIAMQLHEKYGFGKQRLQEIKKGLAKWTENVLDGTVTPQEIEAWGQEMELYFND